MSLISRNLYRFDDFELQPSRRTLLRHGDKVALAPKTFEVLFCLVARSGNVVLKEELLKEVWPDSFVEESNLTQHIFWIRKALADKADYVTTIPGRGYEFIAPVRVVTEAEQARESSPQPDLEIRYQHKTERTHIVMEETTVIAAPAPFARRDHWRLGLTIAAATLGLVAVAVWGAWHWRHRVLAGDHHQVVLADFENTTGDPDFDHSIKTLLGIDLNLSPFLVVATDSEVRRTLKMMSRPPDSDVSPAVAREVCERLNDQVVLSGTVDKVGQNYLVTLKASDCAKGNDLAEMNATAKGREAVISAVDKVAAEMRRRLGEPLHTLHPPGQPLAPAHTFSLEALKAYSQARSFHQQAKFKEAAELYRHATELDPKFFSAYASLANCYNNLGEQELGIEANAKAYNLREQADGPEKFRIITMYEYWQNGDRHKAIRSYQNWTELYPRSVYPWVLMGEFQESVGDLASGIESEKHAITLDPTYLSAYVSLADGQLFDGRLEDAKATCRKAFAHGQDFSDLHHILRDVAYIQHDAAAFDEQMKWYREKASDEERDGAQAELLLSQGKFHAAIALWLKEADRLKKDGRLQAMQESLSTVTQLEADMGFAADAQRHLKQFNPIPQLNGQSWTSLILAAAEVGQIDTAEKVLRRMEEHGPQDSDVQELFAPEGRAAIDIAQGKPEQAIEAMHPALAYEQAFPDVADMRARAYLAAHQPEMAEREFRVFIDRPFVGAISANLAMAHLGAARALEQQGNHAAARQEYETLFSLWKDADLDLPPLLKARREYASLRQ